MARRRGQRVGYLKQYGPSWIGQWREDFLVDGKIKRVKVSTTIARCKGLGAVSKRQAQRIFWETVLSKLDTFSTRPQTMATLAEFIRRKYQPECVAVRKTSGRASVESVLANHILPGLGSLRMRDIGHVEVSEFLLSRLRVGLAPKTVGNMRGLLAAIFSHAKRRDYYSGELPTAYVRLPEMTPRRRRGSLTFAEARTLAEALAPADRALVLLLAIKDHASDLHFEPFEDEFRIRIKADGVLYEMVPPPRHLAFAITTRIKVMANLDIAERRMPQDGRIELTVGGHPVDLRISVLPTMFGESVVMRVLDRSVVSLD
ncbi:hypothetical protein LCGC14_3161830, partial [marine sediment metagenome]